ncbi:MAG: ISAs1 family transposase [Deferrisomatales bacterium]
MVGWQRFNGELPERSCRNLLDRLHRQGWIVLPPSRRPAKTRHRAALAPGPDDPAPASPTPETDRAPPAWPDVGPREDASGPLFIRPILPGEKPTFRQRVQQHHYLGFRPLVGESLCYAAFWNGEPVALLAWCAASLKNAPRDDYIGWSEQAKLERLAFVVQNVRFLILPDSDAPPHLASRVLAANLRRLSRDWQAAYRHPVLLAETFVDESRFPGTCYRAANWTRLGLTRGFGRHSATYRHHGVPKAAWIYPLRSDAVLRLREDGSVTPAPVAKEGPMSSPALKPEALPLAGDGGLLELLLSIPEVRKTRGIRHPLATVLALAVLAMLVGKRSFLAIAQFAANLSPDVLKTLGARRENAPSEPTFRRVLARLPAEEIDAAVSRWILQQGIRLDEAIALDGKICRGSADGDTPAVNLLSALLHREAVVIRQLRVSDKTNEIPCVKPLLQDLPIAGAMVTADALHTQQDTARFLVEEKKADYLFIVKDNQPTLLKDIELLGLTAIPPSGGDV